LAPTIYPSINISFDIEVCDPVDFWETVVFEGIELSLKSISRQSET